MLDGHASGCPGRAGRVDDIGKARRHGSVTVGATQAEASTTGQSDRGRPPACAIMRLAGRRRLLGKQHLHMCVFQQ